MVEFKSDTFKGKTVVSRLVLTALAVDFCEALLLCGKREVSTPCMLINFFALVSFPDAGFLLLMAISGAGPLANQNLYWIKYTGARVRGTVAASLALPCDSLFVHTTSFFKVNGEPFTVLAGMWGTCRIQDSVGFCYKWWDDPFVISIYGNSIFYAIATMQVIAGTLLIVGALSLFLLDPAP